MKKRFILLSYLILSILGRSSEGYAAGISIDSGLTPPLDRWILRNQVRYMKRHGDPTNMRRKMRTYVIPTVLAYGLRPDLTLMINQKVRIREMEMMGVKDKDAGLDDLFIMGKYKLYRRNTRDYTFGIAPTLGLEIPSGSKPFSSDTWDLKPGMFLSWRSGQWASDFNVSYQWNGFADEGRHGIDPGDELKLDMAVSYRFPMGELGQVTWAPVLEVTHQKVWPEKNSGNKVPNTGEFITLISPGLKYTTSSFVFEALFQMPVLQEQRGTQLKQDYGCLLGVRWMF